MRVPRHIGIIPDGNRRWAKKSELQKEEGYDHGLDPGLRLLKAAQELGVQEITYYGFTVDNCKRPEKQVLAFQKACVDAVRLIEGENVDLYVIGNTESKFFPQELLPYTQSISRIDMIIRWGGMRRLSGFLPVQSVYADFFVVDEMWPDFQEEQFNRAILWYQKQDVTLGG